MGLEEVLIGVVRAGDPDRPGGQCVGSSKEGRTPSTGRATTNQSTPPAGPLGSPPPTPCTRRAGRGRLPGETAVPAHPLHAQGRGFTPAGDLRPGDVLRDVDGPAARVIRVRPAGHAQTVHNIEVDTTHACYVATTTATWTLAHNGCTDRIYSNRVLQRSAEKRIDPFHKFPYTFDEYILEHGERVFQSTFFDDVKPNLSRDGAKYTMPGSMRTKGRDYRGIYEIGVRLSENGNAEVIVRRFFRPEH